jgi:hypothetical protein
MNAMMKQRLLKSWDHDYTKPTDVCGTVEVIHSQKHLKASAFVLKLLS